MARSGASFLQVPDTSWKVELVEELDALAESLIRFAADHRRDVESVDPAHREDAVNLLHYLALRRQDVRLLQRRLAEHGLSSLGRSEPHVSATLGAVRRVLEPGHDGPDPGGPSFDKGRGALDVNTDALFGPRPVGRVPRIMVTLPSQAAHQPGLVMDFARRGMDVARINGAHDTPDVWAAMAANVEAAARTLGRRIPVCFDLAGPKVRTGPLTEGPRVRRFHPVRDQRGIPVVPAQVLLCARPSDPAHLGLPVDEAWLARCGPGDELHFRDTRGSPRVLHVISAEDGLVTTELFDTAYIETGTAILRGPDTTTVGELPAVEQWHVLRPGDALQVVASEAPARPWRPGMDGLATIGCTLPAAVSAVRVGDRVVLDDGRLTGVVESLTPRAFVARIDWGSPSGERLRADKGINLPDSHVPVPMLSESDDELLDIAARKGDLLGLSFLRHEDDVDTVLDRLDGTGDDRLGLVLKVETIPGFERLPEIVMRAMRRTKVGVMIARGDLAVETSYERLAEVQEEVLWLSEAAHLPVIWATDVLEQLARTGRPSRAEVTDAAMAQRAECVMLNKGPYISEAITVLDDILRRMAGHQRKKAALLRPLHSWIAFD